MLSNKLKVYLFILLSFFPVFAFKSNLNFIEIIYSIIIFLIPILLINLLFIDKSSNNNYFTIFLSIIIVFGIDNNLGLWNGLIQPYADYIWSYFGGLYIPTLFFFRNNQK